MANIVDVDNAPGDQEGLIKSLTDAVTQNQGDVQNSDSSNSNEQTQNVNTDPLVGTKFEGKGVEELLESYNNLQSAYGRMANDLGTQRKLTDKLLDLKREDDLQQNTPPETVKVDPADLLEDPTKALDAHAASREARIRQEYDEKLRSFETQLQADKFMAKHPDFMDVGQSDEFRAWAQATPVRNRVAQAAAQGDWDAADALLSEYKAAQAQQTQINTTTTDALTEARKVALETSAQGGEGSSQKVYRRADLIDLKISKPHVYADPAFQAEILKAYSEGRVK